MTLDLTNLQPGDELILRDGTKTEVGWVNRHGWIGIAGDFTATWDNSGVCRIGNSPKHDIVSVRRKSAANPLIWGKSIPGTEPVAVKDGYVPLTHEEAKVFVCRPWITTIGAIIDAHRAGWERRRTP